MIEIDRSRIIAYQRCPRERYLAYHHLGKGMQRKSKSLPLVVGSAFHEGAEELLTGDVETAVYRAIHVLAQAFREKGVGFDGEEASDDTLRYSAEEQIALAEAMIRAWGVDQLSRFHDTFEVIEVEKEGRALLSEDLTLLFRPDAIVREKMTGDFYVVSWKTAASYNKRTLLQCRTDMQSMSEVWGVQVSRYDYCCYCGAEMYAGEHLCSMCGKDSPAIRIEGVLYLFIVKGRRSLDEWDNLFKQSTHLIYAWKNLKAGEFDEKWSWSYKWAKEDGSGNSTLGKGWKKVPVWKEYPGGVKGWIEDLHSRRVFPRHVDPFESVFPQSLPVERRKDEVERWRRQVVGQELKVSQALAMIANPMWRLNRADPAHPTRVATDEEVMDELFPQYTHSCHAYSGCQFIDICHNGVPAEPGELYQIRTANHPEQEGEEE